MARSFPVLNTSSAPSPAPSRRDQVRLGIGIEMVTIGWMVIEATIALTTGVATEAFPLKDLRR